MNADGSGKVALTDTGTDLEPVRSPDGQPCLTRARSLATSLGVEVQTCLSALDQLTCCAGEMATTFFAETGVRASFVGTGEATGRRHNPRLRAGHSGLGIG